MCKFFAPYAIVQRPLNVRSRIACGSKFTRRLVGVGLLLWVGLRRCQRTWRRLRHWGGRRVLGWSLRAARGWWRSLVFYRRRRLRRTMEYSVIVAGVPLGR